jgi:c(7)-type cytochrome triheme protein
MRRARSMVGALLLVLATTADGSAVEGDIVFQRKPGTEQPTPPATFPHWFHRLHFKCYVCHDAIFQMKAGANPITMDAISEGKYCGTCHNGKIAFQVGFNTCPRCHRD